MIVDIYLTSNQIRLDMESFSSGEPLYENSCMDITENACYHWHSHFGAQAIGLMSKVFANVLEAEVKSLIESSQKLKKMVFDAALLNT